MYESGNSSASFGGHSEGFFRALVESRSGVMLLFGGDGVIHYASPSVRDIAGVSQERVLGISLWDVLHPEDHERVAGVIPASGAEGISGDFRLRFGSSGEWRVVRGSVQSFLDDPNVNGVVLVGREASQSAETSRKRVEDDHLYHTTFDSAPIGLARVGPDGRWLRVNRLLCRTLGHEREELLGRTFQEITHSDDMMLDLETMRKLLGGEISSVTLEKRFVRKDFSVVWVNISATLIRDESSEPLYFVCVIQDISKERRAKEIADSLTERESTILELLAHGQTNKAIAKHLNLSLSSAKVYVRRVVEKLDATDRTHAAVKAARLGILPDSED